MEDVDLAPWQLVDLRPRRAEPRARRARIVEGAAEGGVGEARVDAHADLGAGCLGEPAETRQLLGRIEVDVIGERRQALDLAGRVGGCIDVHLLAEFLAAEARLVFAARRRAVERIADQRKGRRHRPGFRRQQNFAAGLAADTRYGSKVALKHSHVEDVGGRRNVSWKRRSHSATLNVPPSVILGPCRRHAFSTTPRTHRSACSENEAGLARRILGIKPRMTVLEPCRQSSRPRKQLLRLHREEIALFGRAKLAHVPGQAVLADLVHERL